MHPSHTDCPTPSTTSRSRTAWTDHASGKNTNRPELDAALDFLREGDTLVVWKLDRLGRSLRDLIEIVTGLGERGVNFRSLTEGFDTSTASGKMLFHVMGALAEFERAVIQERTRAGLEAARKRGSKAGKPHKLSDTQLKMLLDRWEHETPEMIAQALGVSRATVYRSYKRAIEAEVAATP